MSYRTTPLTPDEEQELNTYLATLQTRLQTMTPDTLMSFKVWQKLDRVKSLLDETLSRANEEQHTIQY